MARAGPSWVRAVQACPRETTGKFGLRRPRAYLSIRLSSSKSPPPAHRYTDEELCVPKERSWSIHDLLDRNALQAKELNDEELDKLYRLAALQPASSDTERAKIKDALKDMIRLVDAVKHVDTSSITAEEAMHSTVWPKDQSLRLHDANPARHLKPGDETQTDDGTGALPREKLLNLARRTLGHAYIVDRK